MSNTTVLKGQNLLQIIQTIYRARTVTKPEVAKLSGLTAVTAHKFVNEMLTCGICEKTGDMRSSGGRKAELYKINERFGFIIGVEMCREIVKTTVFNLALERVYYNEVPCDPHNVSDTVTVLNRCIRTATEKMGIPKKKYLGISVLMPGSVDVRNGTVIRLPDIPNWTNIPIKSLIEEQFGINVYVENDNNARVLAAKWTGHVGHDTDAVFFSVTDGVGIGVLFGGTLHYGANFYAGEIGHTTIQFDGPLCKCGNRGCIETLTREGMILERVGHIPGFSPGSFEDVMAVAAENHASPVYDVFRETAHYIAIALDHIVKVYNPETIIIDNRWLRKMPELFTLAKETLFSLSPWFRRDLLTIVLAPDESLNQISPACPVFENIMTYSPQNIILQKMKNAANESVA